MHSSFDFSLPIQFPLIRLTFIFPDDASTCVSESEITTPGTASAFSALSATVVMSKAAGSVTVSVKGSIFVSCPKPAVFP